MNEMSCFTFSLRTNLWCTWRFNTPSRFSAAILGVNGQICGRDRPVICAPKMGVRF